MKIFLRILLGLLALLVVLYLAIIFIGTPLVKSAIEKKLAYYPQDSISIGMLELEFFPLGLQATDISFSIHQPGDSLVQLYSGELKELEVVGVDWWRAIRHNTWEAERTEVDEGNISWQVTNTESADSTSKKKKGSGNKANLLLEKLEIKQLHLALQRDSTSVNLQVSARADSLGFNRSDSLRWGYGRIALNSENASYKQSGSDYDLAYGSLELDSRDKHLVIKNLTVKPRITPTKWNKKYPQRKAMIQKLEVPQLELTGFELGRLRHGLFAKKLVVDSVDLRLYNNLRHELSPKRKRLPSEMIAEIAFPVEVDTLSITNSSLLYRYVPKKKIEEGLARLEADQIKMKVYPFSNIGHSTAADVRIDYSMRMMQEAVLTLNAHCIGGSPQHEFTVDVSLSPTSFAAFNPLLYPSLGIKFREGYCDGVSASMRGNDARCDGKLNMAYHDLEIDLPEDQDEGLNLLGEAKEWGANKLLLNSNNDMGENTGNIAYERSENEPFIGYWWRSLQSGLVAVLIRFKDNE